MPVSTSAHITLALRQIIPLAPKRILDVGCGFGLWGFLCRTYLDVFENRLFPEAWQVRIDGIELFEPYIQAHQRALYNHIEIGDITALAAAIDPYDLIICGDVIEHLEKEAGQRVLDQLYEKARQALLVHIPLGEAGWAHPVAYDNPGELHRSQWEIDDFKRFPGKCTEIPLPNGRYGVFFFEKGRPTEERIAGLLATAQDYESAGKLETAIDYARQAIALAPADLDGVPFLAHLLLTANAPEEAVRVIETALETAPDQHVLRVLFCKLLYQLGKQDAARRHLRVLRKQAASFEAALQVDIEILEKQLGLREV